MQPWKISAGLTAALAGSAALLVPPRLECLAPLWPLIITDHGLGIASHLALALGALAAATYAIARAAGLADPSAAASISSSAPYGEARAIPNSPTRYAGTPRASGSEH